MAEAIVGSYNPETGERKESTFSYTPVQPPNPGLMTPDRANAMLQYAARTNPKAVPELYRRLEATMEYQRRQAAGDKNPLTPDVAAGLFSGAGGSALMKPFLPVDPVKAERDTIMRDIAKARLDEMNRKATAPAKSQIRSGAGGGIYLVNPDGTSKTVVPPRETDKTQSEVMNDARLLMAISDPNNPLSRTAATNSAAALAQRVNTGVSNLVNRGSAAAPAGVPTIPTISPISEVVRFTKDGRKAIFDANTKQFIRYAQ